MAIGDTIRSARLERGLSQSDFAASLHVTQQAVTSWEVGRVIPSSTRLPQIAEVLGIESSVLATAVTSQRAAAKRRANSARLDMDAVALRGELERLRQLWELEKAKVELLLPFADEDALRALVKLSDLQVTVRVFDGGPQHPI